MDTSFGMFTHFICKHEIFYTNLTSVIIIGQKKGQKDEHASGDPIFCIMFHMMPTRLIGYIFLCKRRKLKSPLEVKVLKNR